MEEARTWERCYAVLEEMTDERYAELASQVDLMLAHW